jgi:hypothetical protein
MGKKTPVVKFDSDGRELGNHTDPLVDMAPTAPITHARFGTTPSTLVGTDESTLAFVTGDRRQLAISDFENKATRLLKRGRS